MPHPAPMRKAMAFEGNIPFEKGKTFGVCFPLWCRRFQSRPGLMAFNQEKEGPLH